MLKFRINRRIPTVVDNKLINLILKSEEEFWERLKVNELGF